MTNQTSSRASSLLSFLLLPAALTFAVGCGDDGSTDPSQPAALPQETSVVQGPVARENFCALFDKIECGAIAKCCTGADLPFASEDACLAASPCQKGLGQVLGSPRVASDEIRYDAEAAGNFLRAREASKASCRPPEEAAAGLSFLIGAVEEGGNCSPKAGDVAAPLACKPGLRCAVDVDTTSGEATGVCTPADALPAVGKLGDACESEEDCSAGSCLEGKCAPPAEHLCGAPPEKMPPSNATPAKMYVKAYSSKNSGTTGDIKVAFATGGKYYECTITDTISDGGSKECTISYTSTDYGSYASAYFRVENSSNDGLQLDTICAKDSSGNVIECAGTFLDLGASATCNGCSFGYCGRCWLDADGNGKCKKMTIVSDSDNLISCG